ncbi:MAG TPA: hypothetical protein VKP30_11130 [Polyangiaceae bacterium]|nr:hypothetical protein [Polyangiaceae bacterium]
MGPSLTTTRALTSASLLVAPLHGVDQRFVTRRAAPALRYSSRRSMALTSASLLVAPFKLDESEFMGSGTIEHVR